ncbi:tyrosine-type recombinase/integrase [uncultured Thiodictyon sp.]|uniref:tyrosine-type recombinase/integrase n=1 Tax=uncultured Thiodictyon sp. TaxID=1846217 RepID=UPI0025E875E3|nr:tyrosine-type recombinase/integrase [uncultured Thiodictyon sp.]
MHHNPEPKHRGLKLRGSIWWIDICRRVDGRQISIRESTGCREGDLAGAIAIRDRRLDDATGRRAAPVVDLGGPRTFADAAAEYLLDLEQRGKDPSRAEQDIRLVLDALGDLPLDHVHQRTIQPWIDAQRGIRASGTVGRAVRTASTVLRFAAAVLRDGHVPWLAVTPPKLRLPDWGTRQRRPITWEEQDRLIDALPEHLIGPVLFALATGARQAEITTLRWDRHRDVDGLAPWSAWWVPPEIRKASSRLAPSEQQGRYLVAPRLGRAVIERAHTKQESDWVFPSPRGGALYRANNHGWRTACGEAELDIRFHDLRHTFGDRAADAGIPLDIVRSLLGHRHRGITEHYSRPGLVRLLGEVERIGRPAPRLAAVGGGFAQ